jgi:GDP-L-fucose synthase
MEKTSKIYIAGHRGLVGSAIVRKLVAEGYTNILYRTHDELDLTDQIQVAAFFQEEQPEYVFLAAAKVGGIWANNSFPAEFIYQNLMIQTNIIHHGFLNGVKKLLFLGSSCIYPKESPQPMKEEHLLSGYLEPTNEPYAIAKIAGIEMCQSYNRQYGTRFISVMPTNLYGPNDNFDLESSHVLPALLRKFHLAKLAAQKDWEGIKADELCYGPIPEDIKNSLGMLSTKKRSSTLSHPTVSLWGTGAPKREFLHVDDLADACLYLMKTYDGNDILNIGVSEDLTIKELAEMVAHVIGYGKGFEFDPSKPDGTPRKLLDVSKLNNLGWKAKISLEQGIADTYRWYQESCRDQHTPN